MMSATFTIGLLVLSILALGIAFSRRFRAGTHMNLGSVSQQWLLAHKGEDR
jgi:hypothetical protein